MEPLFLAGVHPMPILVLQMLDKKVNFPEAYPKLGQNTTSQYLSDIYICWTKCELKPFLSSLTNIPCVLP